MEFLWERYYEVAERVAKQFGQKYPHLDSEDLGQSVVMHFPKIVERYDPKHGNFDRYAKISLYRACQDECRKDDPLGIQIPQKSHYPMFVHLSAFEMADPELVINDGLSRIDKGYENVKG